MIYEKELFFKHGICYVIIESTEIETVTEKRS